MNSASYNTACLKDALHINLSDTSAFYTILAGSLLYNITTVPEQCGSFSNENCLARLRSAYEHTRTSAHLASTDGEKAYYPIWWPERRNQGPVKRRCLNSDADNVAPYENLQVETDFIREQLISCRVVSECRTWCPIRGAEVRNNIKTCFQWNSSRRISTELFGVWRRNHFRQQCRD